MLTRRSKASGPSRSDAQYWRQRLIRRKYPEKPEAQADREFSVRIENARTSHYFPLGTCDEAEAARRAIRIHRTVVRQGWAIANEKFPRELTLALRWLDDPVAWTYTTIHTRMTSERSSQNKKSTPPAGELNVAVVEPDAGIRRALVWCANSQAGFRCVTTFAGPTEALRGISRVRVDFLLINHTLPGQTGDTCLADLQRLKPALPGLLYSVFEDSDRLFEATPGGAVGYLLKRTPPSRTFEPLDGCAAPVTQDQIASRVREYFQRLSASLRRGPPCPELAKLTPREHQVLALLSKGAVAKEIADTLGISLWTVHGHAKSIFEKLNVHTRTEAVVKYLQK